MVGIWVIDVLRYLSPHQSLGQPAEPGGSEISGPSSVAKIHLFHMSEFTLKILSSVFVMGWNHCHAKRSIILGNSELLENVRLESGGSSTHQG